MTFLKLVLRSLTYHWRINATVALGVAAATAVLSGALIVGDSVRESLRGMTLDRLGRIDEVLLTENFFRQQLVSELEESPAFQEHFRDALGGMLFAQSTLENQRDDRMRLAANVLVVGYPTAGDQGTESQRENGAANGSKQTSSFWKLGGKEFVPQRDPTVGEVILNRRLADELDAKVGDRITIRLPQPNDIPAESPLGEKTDLIRSLPRLEVIEIIENRGLGRFSLHPSQTEPRNAYVALEQLQQAFRQPDTINTILVAGDSIAEPPTRQAGEALDRALQPTLADLGLNLNHPRLTYQAQENENPEVIYDYFVISSDQMILPPAVKRAAGKAFEKEGGQPLLTYLANRIEVANGNGKSSEAADLIPYSMVTAINPSPHFQLRGADGEPIEQLGKDGIALTSWAAEDLGVSVGDEVRVSYFRPEATHGASDTAAEVLTVRAIVPLTPPAEDYLPDRTLEFNERPTLANDPHLTPEVQGVTDQESIGSWEVPFVVDYSLILPEDDRYWQKYGTTPKAFISLATGKRLWGSRFGNATSYRIPAASGFTRAEIRDRLLEELQPRLADLGFAFRSIKRLQLDASRGNTPFDVLFLLLSFFVIAAALLLVALLFRLGFEQRASQAGLLLALGWTRQRLQQLLVSEAAGVAIFGGIVGIFIGLGYAALILAALQSESWWLGAISTPFLEFHFTVRSLVIGFTAGAIVSVLTIFWSIRRTRRVAARQLLGGKLATAAQRYAKPSFWPYLLVAILVATALALAISATNLSGQAQAGAFVGAGTAILAAMLIWIWNVLRSGGRHVAPLTGQTPILMLGTRSAARNPTRSTLTIGLIATASFLIVAMSAFRLQPNVSGTGGFQLLAKSSQPIFADLNTEAGRQDVLVDAADKLAESEVFLFRVRPGDDASCGNLYKARQPRVLGVPASFVHHFDQPTDAAFEFSASAAQSEPEQKNPWRLLAGPPTPEDEPIPVVIDKETAMYSLGLHEGIGEEFSYTYDEQEVTFRVVGLLSLSVLHGNLLISGADFERVFPSVSGYRYALIETPPEKVQEVSELLEDRLSDRGFDVTETRTVLRGLMALQNTYLRTFQTLGALGLLLGTFGLAAAQFRSVLERRGEMGLLRATGFRRRRLALIVLWENVLLLLAGLAAGVIAALLAVLPHMFGGGAGIPFLELGIMLGIVLLVGLVAGWFAAQATLRVPLLEALREER